MNMLIGCVMIMLFIFGFVLGTLKGVDDGIAIARSLVNDMGKALNLDINIEDDDD